MSRKMLFIAPMAIIGMIVFAFIGGQIVMYLWNWLIPSLFGWRHISFWQALGLLALCRILFGGFGMHNCARSNIRKRMDERFQKMTPEEREKLRQGLRGHHSSSDLSKEPNE